MAAYLHPSVANEFWLIQGPLVRSGYVPVSKKLSMLLAVNGCSQPETSPPCLSKPAVELTHAAYCCLVCLWGSNFIFSFLVCVSLQCWINLMWFMANETGQLNFVYWQIMVAVEIRTGIARIVESTVVAKFVVDSLVYCTWKLCRSAWNANTT